MTLLGYFWDRWLYFAGKLSWNISTTQVNSALHSSGVAKLSTTLGWEKDGKFTAVVWQVTQCDPLWHVISRSGEVISITNCYILTFTFTVPITRQVRRYNLHLTSTSSLEKDTQLYVLFHCSCCFMWEYNMTRLNTTNSRQRWISTRMRRGAANDQLNNQ